MKQPQLRVPGHVTDFLRHLHPDMKRKIRAALAAILAEPSSGKQLQRELAGLRSYRVGRLRVVYRQRGDDEIALVAVGPRRVIYEETYRRLQKESEQ
ncbi:MAG TPA: cytotoxin [Lentisphaeria bacterium]|nr:cytotoxin [Lentisphaeria bacterium]